MGVDMKQLLLRILNLKVINQTMLEDHENKHLQTTIMKTYNRSKDDNYTFMINDQNKEDVQEGYDEDGALKTSVYQMIKQTNFSTNNKESKRLDIKCIEYINFDQDNGQQNQTQRNMQYDFVITEFEPIPYKEMMAMCNLPVEYDKEQPDVPLSILGRVDNYKDVEIVANFQEEAESLSREI